MLSFGIDASLALRTAFSSAALPSGSPPPSRAATVIARVSLENCAPLRESTTAFLCLMLAHLECPDIPGSLRIGAGGGPPGTRRAGAASSHAALASRDRRANGPAAAAAVPAAGPPPSDPSAHDSDERPRHLQGLRRAPALRRS